MDINVRAIRRLTEEDYPTVNLSGDTVEYLLDHLYYQDDDMVLKFFIACLNSNLKEELMLRVKLKIITSSSVFPAIVLYYTDVELNLMLDWLNLTNTYYLYPYLTEAQVLTLPKYFQEELGKIPGMIKMLRARAM